MTSPSRGRPPASSQEVLADAACELFLEQGYEATTAADIARRAGVSRSSFFNYFDAKDEILWFGFDRRLDRLATDLEGEVPLERALERFGDGAAPDTLALAIVESHTMGIEAELFAGRAQRQLRIASLLRDRLISDGAQALHADFIAAGYAGALVSAVWRWAEQGAGRRQLATAIAQALAAAREALT